MNYKNVSRGMIALLFVVLVSSFSYEAPVKKFSPVGTWEYSVPDVPEGYQTGQMIIAKKDKSLGVTMALNEYNKTEAEKVEYARNELKFSIWVESEEVRVSGTFDEDKFTGTISYSQGDAEMTAVRKDE